MKQKGKYEKSENTHQSVTAWRLSAMDSSSLWRLKHVAVVLLLGFIVKDVYMWCGKNETEDEGPGMDFESCRRWGSCGNNKLVAVESFWKGLSADVRIAFSQCCSLL